MIYVLIDIHVISIIGGTSKNMKQKETRENKFKRLLNESIKPYICICGKTYNNDLSGGFVGNGITYIYCCSTECANKTINKLY